MPPPLFLFPPFPSLHLHPRSQPAPLPLNLLPPSPACLPGLLRLLLKSPKDSRGRILRRRAGSGPSSPAVHDRRPAPHRLVQPLPEHSPEGQQGVWGVGHAVVWPGHVVELTHRQSLLLLHLEAGVQGTSVRGLFLMGGGTAGAHGGPRWERWKPRLPGELWGGAAAGEELPVEGGGAYMAELQVPDRPVLRHLLPHQRHLQVPVGEGLGVQRPVMLTLHLGGDGWVRLQEAAENLPRSTPAWLWVSAPGTRPRPGNQGESHPSQGDSPFLRSSRAASPHRRPSGWAGGGGRGGVVLGTPEVGSGSTPGPVSRAGSQAAAWRAPPLPRGPGLPHPAGLHAVGQHDQGVALLLPDHAPEVSHGLRQGTLGRNELPGAPETLEGGRPVRAPLPPALTFRGSRVQADPSLTGMKLALMYSEPGCPRRACRGTRDQSSKGRCRR